MSDLISRQAALSKFEQWLKVPGYSEGERNMLKAMLYELRFLPSAQQWIPCSERMPDNNRQVLVYAMSVHFALAKYDEMREADGTYKKQWVTFDAWKPFYTIKEVIAWCPLPEPWKGDKE